MFLPPRETSDLYAFESWVFARLNSATPCVRKAFAFVALPFVIAPIALAKSCAPFALWMHVEFSASRNGTRRGDGGTPAFLIASVGVLHAMSAASVFVSARLFG